MRRVSTESRKARAFGAVDDQPAHVRDVEQADGATRGVMLLDDRAVLHRHRPPGKVDHPSAVSDMPVVKRRASEIRRSFHHQFRRR
jgi:hypothetical protein